VDAEKIERDGPKEHLVDVSGVLVPGGFGSRGIEGKIAAITYAREELVPFFGICLGMQCAVIEFARNVLGLEAAHSTEFDKNTPHAVICLLDEQKSITNLGGTMRLGAQPARLAPESRAARCYGSVEISERHRHRYELNNAYRQPLESHGLEVVGTSPDGSLAEIVELRDHPWFVAVQFHPEFKSQPTRPHPLFAGFVGAAVARHVARAERAQPGRAAAAACEAGAVPSGPHPAGT
jgi:CTP synthase